MRPRAPAGMVVLVTGMALGAAVTVGTTRLVYAGQGFLMATGVLLALTLAATGAGAWGGAPELAARPSPRLRAAGFAVALAVAAAFAGVWQGEVTEGAISGTGAVAAMLFLAAPGYAAGALLVALAGPRSAVAAVALAGAGIGVLFATSTIVLVLEPWGAYLLAGTLVALLVPFIPPHTERPMEGILLDGRVVVVTGVSDEGQVGFAVARRLHAAGARLVVTGLNDGVEACARALGADVVAVVADLATDDGVAAVISAARDRFDRIDGLVNVAGGLSVTATVENTTPEQWHAEYERNAGTAFRMTRAALPLLRASRGAVVSFASPAGERAVASLAAYSAAKAGVIALTRALALEERAHGVRANAIAPGMIDTAQNRAESPDATRLVARESIAETVLFLLSFASAGISGETVRVENSSTG